MSEMIACCGLICIKCEAFLATKNNDDSRKMKIAVTWSKHFDMKFEAEDIDCDGCLSESGRLSGYCRKVCEIRPCARAKSVENCAHCEDYAWEKVTRFFAIAHRAKATLDKIRKNTGK